MTKRELLILIAVLLFGVAPRIYDAQRPVQAANLVQAAATASESGGNTYHVATCGNASEGAYVTLIAATSATSYSQIFWLRDNGDNISVAVDIATGAAASETPIIKDLYGQGGGGTILPMTYATTMTIPAGSRVSARCYGSGAGTVGFGGTIFE